MIHWLRAPTAFAEDLSLSPRANIQQPVTPALREHSVHLVRRPSHGHTYACISGKKCLKY